MVQGRVEILLEQLHNPDVIGLCDRAKARVYANAEKAIREYESSNKKDEKILTELISNLYI